MADEDAFYLQHGMSCTIYGREGQTLQEVLKGLERKGAKEIVRIMHLPNGKIEVCWK